MSKFNVTDSVDELTYNFKPFVDAEGTIPEPSSKQLSAFQSRLLELVPVTADGKIDTAELVNRTKAEDEGSEKLTHELYLAIATLCSNSPNVEQLEALPFRAQQAFVGWIMGTFANPEASAPATKN